MKQLPSVPSATAPLVFPNGTVTPAWIQFFQRLAEQISTLTQTGTLANRPPPGDVYPGTLYSPTDDTSVYRSDGVTWTVYATRP